jgi:ABC-type polysaccharide/polyol phosphate transport system ATPase subunit
MDNEKTIEVKGMGKKFRLRAGGTRTLKSATLDALGIRSGKKEDFWALKDVNFSVGKGETLGIIGANGAGKSTLLSLLAGTKTATEGSIETTGIISSLLELGAGFHPDLTGRENVFLCGALMGIPKSKMVEQYDAIVEFSGIGSFIDQPVKHYSSGMYVRLGFAVAVELDPDILLIDEVLAVGDSDFQRKCIAKMEEFREKGKTMLIISHDLKTIQSVSDQILLLDEGKVVGIGDPEELVERYESITRKKNAKSLQREWGTGEAKIAGVEFFDKDGNVADKFMWGDPLDVRIDYESSKKLDNPVFGFAISDEEGHLIYGNNTQLEEFQVGSIDGKGSVKLRLNEIAMATGTYLFSFSIHSADHKTNYHRVDNLFPIAVESTKEFEGCCHMPCKWFNG